MKKMMIAILAVMCASAVSVASAADGLEVSFALYRAGHYVAPIGNRIIVGDRPFPFYVLVKNASDRAAEIYEKKGELNERHLEFEFVDSKGVKTVVVHKEAPSDRERGGYRMMQPQESQVASVLLHPGSWTLSLTLPTDKDSEFTLRVVYVNKNKRVYSTPYKVTIKAMN